MFNNAGYSALWGQRGSMHIGLKKTMLSKIMIMRESSVCDSVCVCLKACIIIPLSKYFWHAQFTKWASKSPIGKN